MLHLSTTSRILLGFLLFLAAGLYFVENELTQRVEREYLEAAEETMVDVAQVMAAILEEHVDETGALDLALIRRAWTSAHTRPFVARIYDFTKVTLDMNALVTDRRGIVLFDSDADTAEGRDYRGMLDVAQTLSGNYGARSTKSDPADDESSVMFVAAPIRHRGEITGVVSVSKPQRSLFAFRDATKRRIRTIGLIFFAAVTAGAYLVIKLFSRPIRRLTDYARAITRGERAVPPRGGSPETATLGRAFEDMRDALENRAYVENYVQTVTHEMKSPVAAIRGAAELLREDMPLERREKFLANIQAEAGRLQNIIDRLLALSALESRKTLEHPEPIALAEIVAAVCATHRPAAEARGQRITVEIHAKPEVAGEAYLLETALSNLVQNAIEFSPEGGAIRVQLDADTRAAEIIIEDEGTGIPDYALPRVFERFYSLQRPGNGRKSSGLGLCFVREAAALHGGGVAIENHADRRGVRAVLRLPVRA